MGGGLLLRGEAQCTLSAPLGLLEIAAAGMVWHSVCGAGVATDVAAGVVVGVLVLVTASHPHCSIRYESHENVTILI